MDFINEIGSELSDISEGREMDSKELMREYSDQIKEAAKTGNKEREIYYKTKLDRLEQNTAENNASKENYGSAPFPEIKRHQEAAMSYERKANELERKIQRGQEPQKRMQEVNDLRKKAKREKDAAESARRYYRSRLSGNELGTDAFPELSQAQETLRNSKKALNALEKQRNPKITDEALENKIAKMKKNVEEQQQAYDLAKQQRIQQLRMPYRGGEDVIGTHTTSTGHQGEEISFLGGMGASEIEHIRGSQMVSEANQKRSTAATFESDARRARSAGDTSKADELQSRVRALRSEASSLESKGKNLMKKG